MGEMKSARPSLIVIAMVDSRQDCSSTLISGSAVALVARTRENLSVR
jgi:hypothetical protein